MDETTRELSPNDPEGKRVCVRATVLTNETTLLTRIEHFSDWSRAVKGIARLQLFLSQRTEVIFVAEHSIRSVRLFYAALVTKMVKKLPHDHQLLRELEVLRPQMMERFTSQSGTHLY